MKKTFIAFILLPMFVLPLKAENGVLQPITDLDTEYGVAVRIQQEIEVIKQLTAEGKRAQALSGDSISINFDDVNTAVQMIHDHLVHNLNRKYGH